ncbi:hypothetical protein MMC18_003918, partial [Xylographa bjoerkii]|nr:hypothetical protein [Xylographa bjoerkii]
MDQQKQSKSPAEMLSEPVRTLKPINWFLVVFSLLAALFLFALDNTIVADVQPHIINTLGEIDKLPWISVAFALGGISTNLFWSKLYGSFDNKWLFISSIIIFEVGSVVCGAAASMNGLIVARAICGVGGMGLYLGTINMVSTLTTEAERPVYLGFIGLTWGIGTILGPVVGGAFADSSATWRWSFYINLCIGGMATPVFLFLLPSFVPRSGFSILARAKQLDFAGAILVAGAFTSLVTAVSFGGSVYAWNSGPIIGLFVCTGILWILFPAQQIFCLFTTKEHRLFPVDFVKSIEMDILFASTAAAQVVIFISIYFLPLYFQFVLNDAALTAGVRLLPFVLVMVFAVMFNGAMMAKLGYYMPWYLVGGILAVIGTVLLSTISVEMSVSRIYGYSVIAALGVGLFGNAGFSISQVKVEPKLLSQAIAFIGVGQVGGIALALTISNSMFLNEATQRIAEVLPTVPRTTVQSAVSGADGSFFKTLSDKDKTDVLYAIVESIQQ